MRRNARMVLAGLLACLVALLFSLQAAAQQEDPSHIYQKKTIVDIPEETYRADGQGPDIVRVDAERRARLGNLIRWRDDFRDKVLGSARSL